MSGVSGVPGVDFGIEEVRGSFPEEMEVAPLERPPDATVRLPGSKSITNRALLVAALAGGTSRIENPLLADDPFWLMNALVGLGFGVRVGEEGAVEVAGGGGGIPAPSADVFVGNAGTVARFLPPALALGSGPYRVDGTPRMRERPVAELVEALRALGARVECEEREGHLPLVVRGGARGGGEISVSGERSSQFLSGLLISAPCLPGGLTVRPRGALVSRPYVDITVRVMRSFGASVEEEPSGAAFRVAPGAYRATAYRVEPDASAASYFLAAAALTAGRVVIPGLGRSSLQGDVAFAGILRRMGCRVSLSEDRIELAGPPRLRGVEADMNAISDTMMTLAAIAPFASSPTLIKNVAHTRLQETDRLAAVAAELSRLGVRVHETPDSLRIIPGKVRPAAIRTYGDHRMAMAFSLVGLRVRGVRILDPGCVTKTLPGYFRLLEGLRRGG
ncbi:3-phosphoshikimate 1-carboxyvinyltransferase [Rubrobacter xylanophilus DSM 9941]|uniref:3-phosphoshikimate 1-carboxyvinyltransferase n=1 Tax=Rubrobacter xylanophilus (strain DSM 9941 / JCM 11954 / NBRC 16129 / PRD-1) TaxID=266117 RepID=Q1AW25_RUBXD|nr:3-phosphoshikimate 1-carboxyvinyltransferase [Rubrobacter xylanophilus]ABG04403.1 3-phosphoshikimate 1-carboxyvinyltransferase [Rubrobacter xylanophilus DSM 9941]